MTHAMELVRDTTFEVGWLTWQLRPPTTSLTVIVKATFAISADGACVTAEEQPPVGGDLHHDDDERKSVRVESDLAIFKPRAECLLAGTCHPPSGSARVSAVSMRVASPGATKARTVDKAIAVFGDRRWRRSWHGAPPEPEIFESMPLRWERSFGGSRCDDNPVGRGLDEDRTTDAVWLPNLEHPSALVTERGSRPKPAGFFPISRAWKPRAALTGTYDARWKKTRFPWFPEDFDLAYHNAAPLDQRIDGYWTGDETITLRNLVRGRPIVEARLPGIVARAFVRRRNASSNDASVSALEEVVLRLDTIAIDSDAGTVTCLWRGLVEVAGEDLADVAQLFVTHEARGENRSLAENARRLDALRAGGEREEIDAFGEDPPENQGDSGSLPVSSELRDAVLGSALAAAAELPAFVDACLACGQPLTELDLSGVDLAERVLDGCNLSGSILANANLRGASLRGAVLDGAVLDDADLDDADLREASLVGCSLDGLRARRAKLDGARLDGAQAERADFEGASFRGASLRAAILEGANLSHTDLERACLDQAELGSCRLERAVLLDASLVDASLVGADASRAVFDRAELTGIRACDGATLRGVSLRNCRGVRASFRDAVLDESDLFSSDLESADLAGASLVAANLDGCVLRNARLERAKLVGARARGADLFEACLEEADLSHADLRGANLFGAETWRAKTTGIRLESALIGRTKLEDR